MKANELRIGNLLRFNNLIEPERIIKVTGRFLIPFTTNGNNVNNYFQPIPLTEEWLMKFEFEKHPTKDYYYHDCGEYVIRVVINAFSGTIDNDSSWFISIQTGFASQPVTLVRKYVHQLQNLYFALTGEEL